MAVPTEAQEARVRQAIIAKAIRFMLMPGTPFGVFGIGVDGAAASVRPDHAITEMLYGLRFADLDISAVAVTAAEVIRSMDAEADDFNESKEDDVDRAIEAAKDWVSEYLAGGVGIA